MEVFPGIILVEVVERSIAASRFGSHFEALPSLGRISAKLGIGKDGCVRWRSVVKSAEPSFIPASKHLLTPERHACR